MEDSVRRGAVMDQEVELRNAAISARAASRSATMLASCLAKATASEDSAPKTARRPTSVLRSKNVTLSAGRRK